MLKKQVCYEECLFLPSIDRDVLYISFFCQESECSKKVNGETNTYSSQESQLCTQKISPMENSLSLWNYFLTFLYMIDRQIDRQFIFRNIRTIKCYGRLKEQNMIQMMITQHNQRRCSVGRPYSIKLFSIADLISTVGTL